MPTGALDAIGLQTRGVWGRFNKSDGLALIDTMGDSEDEDVTAERPSVLRPLVGNWDKI